LEKVVVIIDPDNKHDVPAPAPVSDNVMVVRPAYRSDDEHNMPAPVLVAQ